MKDRFISTSPVALFVYNRPEHTRRTVEALQRNELANKSDLFIFSDAPRMEADLQKVFEVRKYLKMINGFRSINVFERENNYGLANSIIDGVSRLCAEFGRVVVLEDDLVVSSVFLEYMNFALNKYHCEQKVMQISGNMFPILNKINMLDAFFCRITTSWGWATWDRAWCKFEPNAQKLVQEIKKKKLCRQFDSGGNYFHMLVRQSKGEIDSWAIRWFASVFLSGGLCLHPSLSLVANIGHDGTGTHCEVSKVYDGYISPIMPASFPTIIEESIEGRKALETFFRSMQTSSLQRFISRAQSFLNELIRI